MYSGNFLHSDYLLARPKARLAVPVDLINSQPIIRVIPSPDYKIGSIANFLRKPDVPNLRVLAKWLKEKDLDIFVGGSVIYNPFVGKTKNQYKDIDVTAVSEDQGKINLVMEYLDVLVTEQIPFITDLHSSWLYGYKSKSSWKKVSYNVQLPLNALKDDDRRILTPYTQDFIMKGSRYTPKMAPIDISFMTLEEFRDSAIQNLEHILLSEKDSLS